MDITHSRPGRFIGLMNQIERERPSRATARRLHAFRRFLFVTCAPEDEARIQPIADLIERDGHALWIDHVHLPTGPSYARDAVAALRACRAMLVFCSGASYGSPVVRREIAAAYRLGKPILPVVLDDEAMPDGVSFYLGRWPAVRLEDPHWKLRLRSAAEAVSRGGRTWQGSPPVVAECATVLVVT